MKSILKLSFLFSYYTLLAIFRQARYGIQFFILPALGLTSFLAVYAAVRIFDGNPENIFYPFLVFNMINYPAGGAMQLTYFVLLDSSEASAFLASPMGVNALFGEFLGDSWATMFGNFLAIIVALFITKPEFHGLSTIVGLILLFILVIPSVKLGIAVGMKFVFSNQLSQLIMSSFFLFLILPTSNPWVWVTLPFSAALDLLSGKGMPSAILYGFIGTVLWWLAAKYIFQWAYNQYRLGKGVDRI